MRNLKLILICFLFLISVTSLVSAYQKEYNFNATYQGVNAFAWVCTDVFGTALQQPEYATTINLTCSSTLTTTTTNNGYDNDDTIRVASVYSATGLVNGSFQTFRFKFNESPSVIQQVNITTDIYSVSSSDPVSGWIWNFTSSGWNQYVSNFTTEADIYKKIIINFTSDNIDSENNMYVMFYIFEGGGADELRIDFIGVNISYIIPSNVTKPQIIKTDPLYTNQSLNCSTLPSDIDNSSSIVEFIWYNNSIRIPYNDTNVTCLVDQTCYTNKLYDVTLSSHFDNITCSTRAYDGTTYSSYYNSTTITIQNYNVTLDTISLNDTTVTDVEDLNCTLGTIIDIDGDTLIPYYDWLLEGVSQGITTSNLSNTRTTIDDIWQCRSWIGDTYVNSSNRTSGSVAIESSYIAPIINYTNATAFGSTKQSDSINPTNNNTLINISINITDANVGDNWTGVVCTTSDFSNGNCSSSSNFLCSTAKNTSFYNLWCTINISSYASGSFTYYTSVRDNTSLDSSALSGTFWVNHPTSLSTIREPTLNNSKKNRNWTILNSSCSDANSEDTIMYSYYNNLSGSFDLIYNSTTSSYNFTNLNETTYYIISNCKDDSNYTSGNSSIYYFSIDITIPNGSVSAPVQGTTYTSRTITLTQLANDTNLDSCFYSVMQPLINAVDIVNTTTSCSFISNFNVSASTDFTLYFYVNDTAGNLNLTTINFSVDTSSNSGGGGGGGAVKIQTIYQGVLLKRDCNLDINPTEFVFSNNDVIKKVEITSNENVPIGLKFRSNSKSFIEVRGATTQLLNKGDVLEASIIYIPIQNLTKDIITTVVIYGEECKDVILTIEVNGNEFRENQVKIGGIDIFAPTTSFVIPFTKDKKKIEIPFFIVIILTSLISLFVIIKYTKNTGGFAVRTIIFIIMVVILSLILNLILKLF